MNALKDKRVAFTGKLASMTRAKAAKLVRAQGGVLVSGVTRQTSILVIGQEGWPLQKDGRVSRKLLLAKKLQTLGHEVVIVTEEEWLQKADPGESSEAVHRRFALPQLGRLLKLPRSRIEAWIRAGLVAPVETAEEIQYFDYLQVARLRTLWELAQAGVSTERLKASLKRLAAWLGWSEATSNHLQLLQREGDLLVRLGDGTLAEPSGQLRFDFQDDHEPATVASPQEVSAGDWQQRGYEHENAGNLEDAAQAYRKALYHGGPNAEVSFNLANVLYSLGQFGQAAERFRQAVELDHGFADAWNNLGNTLVELGQLQEGIDSFRAALKLRPNFADAHYNLADALQTAEQFSEARSEWKEYLRLEPTGDWAAHARRCLNLSG